MKNISPGGYIHIFGVMRGALHSVLVTPKEIIHGELIYAELIFAELIFAILAKFQKLDSQLFFIYACFFVHGH